MTLQRRDRQKRRECRGCRGVSSASSAVRGVSRRVVPDCIAGFALLLLVSSLLLPAVSCAQQQPMGAVGTADARVTGQVAVRGSQAELLSNVNVTAFDRTAPVSLTRGGGVLVCSTSEFHLLRTAEGPSLVFALDRGALQLETPSQGNDIIITPDIQFSPVTKGTYDLRLRVTREGDTCVDNAGANAPVLNAVDTFSAATYRVLPGQHLMFVKGDLHKVVDHERSPCGCPPSSLPQTLAGKPGQPATPAQAAAAAHPFPEAQSEGLAPTTAPNNEAPVGTASSQVSTTFSYGEGATPPPGDPNAVALGGAGQAPVLPPPPEPTGFFHSIGRFFHRLFHPGA